MDLSNVLQLMSYADMYNAKTLYKVCGNYVDSRASTILSSHSLLIIPKEFLKSLLSRDSFYISEIDIFEAVMRWKDYNGFETEDIEDVLGCIRLTEIPTPELQSVVEPSGVYSSSTIKEALQQSVCLRQPRGKSLGKAKQTNY